MSLVREDTMYPHSEIGSGRKTLDLFENKLLVFTWSPLLLSFDALVNCIPGSHPCWDCGLDRSWLLGLCFCSEKTVWDHWKPGCTVQVTSLGHVNNAGYFYYFTHVRRVAVGMILLNVLFGQQLGVWCVCWNRVNPTKFNKAKCKSCAWVRATLSITTDWVMLESNPMERNLAVLVNIKLGMSRQRVLAI